MFAHEKLHVYGKALAFAASATACSAGWDKGHAVVDPLGRASDSVILNLADGARFQAGASKVRALDYSMGSTLGWAACLDVARIKNLLEKPQTDQEK